MGPRGDLGYRGDPGDQTVGPPGEKGNQGVRGDPGRPASIYVINEVQGNLSIITKGNKGERGLRGIQGVKGIKGERGSVGHIVSITLLN